MESCVGRCAVDRFIPYRALCNAFEVIQNELVDYHGGCLEVSVAALGGTQQVVKDWAQERMKCRLTPKHTLARFLRESQLHIATSLSLYQKGCINTASLSIMSAQFNTRLVRGSLLVGRLDDGSQHAIAVVNSQLACQISKLSFMPGEHLIIDANSLNFYDVATIETAITRLDDLQSMHGYCIFT